MFQPVPSEAWRKTYPGAVVGGLVLRGLINPPRHAELEARKTALEEALRARWNGVDRAALRHAPPLDAYSAYYRRFGKTYHVQLQLESLLFKARSIPTVSALVEAMFMAELEDLLLTAGHDVASLEGPVRVEVASGEETFERLSGGEQRLKAGDMYMADDRGIISVVLHGPDRRTSIRSETREAFFAVYAPSGVGREAVRSHLERLREYVLVVSPQAETLVLQVHEA